MIVRSLLTLLGFQTDTKQLVGYEKALTSIFSAAKIAAVGVIALGTAAFKTAGDMEQVEIAFETMLGSADAANKLIQDITTFAAQTPFELKGLVDSSKQLLAFGFAAESIIPTMTTLGDIAAGVGKDKLETIVRSLGKIRTKGKASMEELNMMLEAGVPILDALSARLGVTQATLFKMISKGQVDFNDVNQALTDLATGTGKFAGLMKKQSKSFLGILSNIGDFLYNLTASVGKDLLPIGKEVAKAFLDFMEANREVIKVNLVKFFKGLIYVIVFVIRFIQRLIERMGGLEKLGQVLSKVFSNVGKIFMFVGKIILTVLLFIWDQLDKVVNLFGGWEKVLSFLIPVIVGIIAAIKAWAIIQGILNAVMSLNPIGIIILAIGALIAAIILLVTNWKKVSSFLKNVWSKFAEWWAALWEGIGKWFSDRWDQIVYNFSVIWKNIVNFIVAVVKVLVKIFTMWNDFWNGVWEKAKKIILDIWQGIVDGVKNLWQGAVNFIMGLWQGILDFIESIKKFGQGVADFFSGLFGGKKEINATGNLPPAGVMTGGTSKGSSVNVNSNVTIGIPAGTPAEQKAYVEKNVKDAIRKEWGSILREGMVNNSAGAR